MSICHGSQPESLTRPGTDRQGRNRNTPGPGTQGEPALGRRTRSATGDKKTPGGTVGPLPSPLKQAPAVSRLRSIGPFGQDHYAVRNQVSATVLSTTFAIEGVESGRLSTVRPPRPPCRERGSNRGAHGNARRNQSIRWSVAADASTCDSVPSSLGPNSSPPMQAPASSRPVRHGPFGQDLMYGPVHPPGYGVIHQLQGQDGRSSLVVHGPSTTSGQPSVRSGRGTGPGSGAREGVVNGHCSRMGRG
jgi:hypothetical protein